MRSDIRSATLLQQPDSNLNKMNSGVTFKWGHFQVTLIYIIFIKSVNNNIFYFFKHLELRLIYGKLKPYKAFYTTIAEKNNSGLGILKEQRVDGSCIGKSLTLNLTLQRSPFGPLTLFNVVKEGSQVKNNFPILKYTLMGFERNYQVRTLTNQLIDRNSSTLSNIQALNP